MKIRRTVFVSLFVLLIMSLQAEARILPGLIDRAGNPVHTADEFTLQVATVVTPDPQGYRYTYNLTNDGLSSQGVWWFVVFVDDAYSMVKGSSNSPWGKGAEPSPKAKEELWAKGIRWNSDPDRINPPPLLPGQSLSGFSFLSTYPPGIIQAYAEGFSNSPWYENVPLEDDDFDTNTPYGPGKVFAVIGPVKPVGAIAGAPASNVTVQSCAGTACTVQINATGPMDPYGTAYKYTWTGPFGSASGINPTLQLPAGTTPVTLSVTDSNGTQLATATIDVVVVNPNPAPAGDDDDRSDDEHDDNDGHKESNHKGHERH